MKEKNEVRAEGSDKNKRDEASLGRRRSEERDLRAGKGTEKVDGGE